MKTSVVTEADHTRGWAELEVEFLNGSRLVIRVHTISQDELFAFAERPDSDSIIRCLMKALRRERAFVQQIKPEYLSAAAGMLAFLASGDVIGEVSVSHAAQFPPGNANN